MRPVAMAWPFGLGLVVLLAGANPTRADEPSGPAAGPRVRLTAPTVSARRLIGTLVGQDDATITLQREGANTLTVPRGAITRIEVSQHRSSRAKGLGIGVLVGLAAAVAIGVGAGEDCSRDAWLCFDRTTTTALSALLTVPVGALVGVAAAPGERWQATTPDRLRVAVAPVGGGGVRASLSLRF